MGITFDYVLAYLGFSAPSGAAAVWGEWPAPMDLLSLAGLLAKKRPWTFCLPLLPPAHMWDKKFPAFFSGYKVALCSN